MKGTNDIGAFSDIGYQVWKEVDIFLDESNQVLDLFDQRKSTPGHQTQDDQHQQDINDGNRNAPGDFNLFVVKVARGLIRYANKMAVINGPRKL